MKRHYLASKLLQALKSKKPIKVIIAGRGTGKSTYFGWEMYECFRMMPRSLGALSGPTYNQILTKILPSAKKTLKSLGLKEDERGHPGHFTIGKRPPKHFKKPYNEPERYAYVLSLFNGSSIEFLSMDRPDLARGGSYDYMLHDEAVYGKKKMHENVLEMTLRGNRQYFQRCYKHGMQVFVSSQAHSRAGYWVEDQKYLRNEHGEIMIDENGQEMMDPEVEFQKLTSYDNIAILGEKTLKRWEKKLTAEKFRLEILAERPEKIDNSFYPAWDHNRHTYSGGFEYDYDDKTEYGIFVKRKDVDRDPGLGFLATCDFNAAQNTFIVAQEQDGERTLRFLNEFYRSGNDSIEEWLGPFCEYYKAHRKKVIYIYGDPGGNKKELFDQKSIYENMSEYLSSQGWKVINQVKGTAYPAHMTKQKFIHEILAEENPRLPRVRLHDSRCRYLILSIENTGILPNFQKDKSSERQDIDQRTATHGSDSFDYLLYFRYARRRSSTSGSSGRVMIGDEVI